jgi:hypothetical protein
MEFQEAFAHLVSLGQREISSTPQQLGGCARVSYCLFHVTNANDANDVLTKSTVAIIQGMGQRVFKRRGKNRSVSFSPDCEVATFLRDRDDVFECLPTQQYGP